MRRPDPRRIVLGPRDPSLSSFGGLVAFNTLIDDLGVGASLRSLCAPLKAGRSVVYPMETQVRLLLDLFVVGGTRLFDLEYLASDPLFVHLAGGRLCCLDTLGEWREQGLPPIRLVVVRSRERQGGKQLDDSGLTVQAFFTNDWDSEAEDVILTYDERAGIEPLLAELKQSWGLEKVSSHDFGANAALLLLKGLAMNLLRRLARQQAPTAAQRWRTRGLRQLLILRPARIVRTGRRVVVRLGGLPVEVKHE